MKKIRGIRKRWMVNSISVVLFIVLLAVTAFSTAMGSYYYSTMSESLRQKAENAIGSFDYRSGDDYYSYARTVVAGDPNSDNLEVEYLDSSGRIRFSSSDLTAFRVPGTPEIVQAISEKETRSWVGSDPSTGEHIMAATSPLVVNGEVVGAMRYVTSLRNVDRQIIIIVAIALGIGLAILCIVYFSNLYFIRSIVDPVAGITETAKRIAEGSYGVQIEKRYDDEIGTLADAINDMSLRINQSEKMKNEFISSVSHELRTPLTAINGWAETIMNGEVRDAGDVKKGMGIIVSEARRLTNMVEELLEFSRIQDGRFTLSVEPMEARRLRQAHRHLHRPRRGSGGHHHPGLRPRHPGGGAAPREVQVLQGLLQGPGLRHRPGGVRRDRHPPRGHPGHRQRRGRRVCRHHPPAHSNISSKSGPRPLQSGRGFGTIDYIPLVRRTYPTCQTKTTNPAPRPTRP